MTPEAWETLITQYYEEIYRFSFRFLGNAEDAADITQETFLAAYQRGDANRDEDGIRAWLYVTARNRCIDRHRSLKRWTQRVKALVRPEAAPSPEDGSDLVQKLLERLPRRQREIFILRHWHGFSTRGVAELLSITEGAVKSHLSRAVEKMKEMLKREDL